MPAPRPSTSTPRSPTTAPRSPGSRPSTDGNVELRDIAAGTTTLITPDTKKRGRGCKGEAAFICGEVSTPAISPDGKLIGFESIGMGYVKGDAKHINVQISK